MVRAVVTTLGSRPTLKTRESAKAPVRDKGKRTRERLLEAAKVVFERDGFVEARVADIATEANLSHGSFYTYFDSKGDVFREVARSVIHDMYHALDAAANETSARTLIHAANDTFMTAYAKHAQMLALIEQVATFDEDFREMRLELRHRLVRRVERAVGGMTVNGETNIDPLDRHVLAHALAGMVDNFAYAWFILQEPFDTDLAVDTLDEIWMRALGIGQRRARKTSSRGAKPAAKRTPAAAKKS